jgi:hypothetical protein
VDGPDGKHFFDVSNDLVGGGHMSGLSLQSICPRALMKSDDRNSYQRREQRRLEADDVRQVQSCHAGAKAAVHAIARISQHDARRDARAMSRADLIERNLWLRLELDFQLKGFKPPSSDGYWL